MANTIQHEAYDPNKLSPTYALLIRIRLSSFSDVLAGKEFQSRAAKREDPLREFSRICGAELEAIQKP